LRLTKPGQEERLDFLADQSPRNAEIAVPVDIDDGAVTSSVCAVAFRSWITTVQALRGTKETVSYLLFVRPVRLNESVGSDSVPKTWGMKTAEWRLAVA
jgi:hypothetical protein